MAKADLGLKRTCLSCGMRYYDFNRTPITCPGCQTEFDPEAVIRSRRGRATAKDVGKGTKVAEEALAENLDDKGDEDEAAVQAGAEEAGDNDDIGYDNSDVDADNDDGAGLISDGLDEDDEILPGIPNDDE